MHSKPIDRIMNRFFDGEIGIEDADKEIQEYLTVRKFDEKIIRRLDKRRDLVKTKVVDGKKIKVCQHRTYAEFFRDISIGIRKEHAMFIVWVDYMRKLGYGIRWEKYGTDAIGLAFLDLKEEENNPDYLLSINNSPFYPVDVKTCEKDDINTFKVSDLKNYSRHDSLMLVLTGEAKIDNPKLNTFIFYGQKAVRMLSKQKSNLFHEFAPNKPAVRVAKEKFMRARNAQISFKKLLEQKLIDICHILEEGQPIFTGPLRKIINTDFSC